MRGERLAEGIHRELAEIVTTRVRDPRLALATVTRVEISTDGAHARVYVSFLGDDLAGEEGLHALAGAAAFIRRDLGRRLAVRRVPELDFRLDVGTRHSLHIQAELRELGLDDSTDSGPAPDSPDRGEG